MGCLVLGGGEQEELVKLWTGAKKASCGGVGWVVLYSLEDSEAPPHLYLPQQMQTPPFTAELFCFPCTPRATEGWDDTLRTLGTQAETIHIAVAC